MEGMKVAVTKIKTKRVQRRKIRIIERRITLTGIEKDYIYEDANRTKQQLYPKIRRNICT